jgi:hypothetical protein
MSKAKNSGKNLMKNEIVLRAESNTILPCGIEFTDSPNMVAYRLNSFINKKNRAYGNTSIEFLDSRIIETVKRDKQIIKSRYADIDCTMNHVKAYMIDEFHIGVIHVEVIYEYEMINIGDIYEELLYEWLCKRKGIDLIRIWME